MTDWQQEGDLVLAQRTERGASVTQVGVGTVESYSPSTTEAHLWMDDGGEAWAKSMTGPLERGARVVIGFQPGGGMFVIGRLFGDATELPNDEVVGTYATYVPLTRHGGGPGIDNTDAFADAVAEALDIGAAGVLLPPVPAGERWYIEGRVDMGGLDLVGQGQDRSIIECTDAAAGIDLTEYAATRQYSGYSGNFSVFGGPSLGNGIADEPLVIGLRVNARFSNIRSQAANPASGTCLTLATLQNSMLDTIWLIDGFTVLRFTAGASSNLFVKGEVAGARDLMVSFDDSKPPTPGQFPYTIFNTIQDTILEGPFETCRHYIDAPASALNKIDNCNISVNGPLFGQPQPDGMTSVVNAVPGASGQGSLIVVDCKLIGGGASGEGADVGYYAAGGGRIHLSGGSVGLVPVGARGNVIVEADPWFFSTCPQPYDLAGIMGTIPRHERRSPDYFRGEAATSYALVTQVVGEPNVRMSMTTAGAMRWGDGTAATDVGLGRINPGILGTFEAFYTQDGLISHSPPWLPVSPGSTLGTLIGKAAVKDVTTGNVVGYFPIYDAIT